MCILPVKEFFLFFCICWKTTFIVILRKVTNYAKNVNIKMINTQYPVKIKLNKKDNNVYKPIDWRRVECPTFTRQRH